MAASNRASFWVFRDTANEVELSHRVQQLEQSLKKISGTFNEQFVLRALIEAGELESCLADNGCVASQPAMRLTEIFAGMLIARLNCVSAAQALLLEIKKTPLPAKARVSPFEGFAYYAVHPKDFAKVEGFLKGTNPVAVIGIRSIGTVLSAVATVAIQEHGIPSARITVRPEGHPYTRQTKFSSSQMQWIEEWKQRDARFLIVDEGPGLSGSSFLSVAEALTAFGVNTTRIALMGTREADPFQLCTPDAATRWKRFSWGKSESSICQQFGDNIPLGGGKWRNFFLQSGIEWPACWPQMERLKYLAHDGDHLLKFEGFGSYGERARERSKQIFAAGFGPAMEYFGDGMTRYQFVAGFSFNCHDASADILERMAVYCAFRAHEFRAGTSSSNHLEEMARFNFRQEFGQELDIPAGSLETENPITTDSHMQPHEWIQSCDTIIKVDGCTHGDDHFFPGPTDIAWDLAGAIVEWNLSHDGENYFIQKFRRAGGVCSEQRLNAFIHAYAVFRMAYCGMALNATQDIEEQFRLKKARAFYKQKLVRNHSPENILQT